MDMIRRFASRMLISALSQGKLDFLAKQYKTDPEIVEAIAEYDPSPNSAYVAWLCKVYKGGPLQSLEKLTEPLRKFMKLLNNPEFPKDKRDIGKYEVEDLMALVGSERRYLHNLSVKEIERKLVNEGLPGAKLVWDEGGYKVWAVTNAKYARFLGSNTKWCTANDSYSVQYCEKGVLYPVWKHGKPVYQGHIYHDGGQIEFLDKAGHSVEVFSSEALELFGTIQLLVFQRFAKNAYTERSVENALEKNDPDLDFGAVQEVILGLDNPRLVMVYCLSHNTPVWGEGCDVLLDFPELALTVLKTWDLGRVAQLQKASPEVASDWAILSDDDSLSLKMAVLRGEPLDVEHMVKIFVFAGDKLPEILLSPEYRERAVAALKPLPLSSDFLLANKSMPELEDRIFEFWKSSRRRKWTSMESVIGKRPGYVARMEEIAGIPSGFSRGARVLPGPDCEFSAWEYDKVGVITQTSGSEYTVDVGGEEFIMIHSIPQGLFTLKPAPKVTYNYTKITPNPDKLEVGMRVVTSEAWPSRWNPIDGVGTVVRAEDAAEGDGYQVVTVEWGNAPEGEYHHGPGYERLQAVTVDAPADFSHLAQLKDGDRVKRGPTWDWRDQDGGGEGEVIEVSWGGWHRVKWDAGHVDSYQYGKCELSHGPGGAWPNTWAMDIVPVSETHTPQEWLEIALELDEADGDWVPED